MIIVAKLDYDDRVLCILFSSGAGWYTAYTVDQNIYSSNVKKS